MKQRLAIELIVVLGLSATALVAAQRGGSAPAPAPAAAQRPSLAPGRAGGAGRGGGR